MNQQILIYVVLHVLQYCWGQSDEEVNQYVKEIQKFQAQVSTWKYPENSLSYLQKNTDDDEYFSEDKYDFIIVGCGAAGSVLANRLSEITSWKILVLEAGTWENTLSEIPGMRSLLLTSDYNWGYVTTPQGDRSAAYLNNSFGYARGKAVGGSTVINALVYARGNKDDFDRWGKDNPGWDYDSVLPYFRKSERASFPNASLKYHGNDGPVNVEYTKLFNEVGEAFLEAQRQLNRTVSNDYNGEIQTTFSIVQANEINGRSDSNAKAYINPARNRTNLRIVRNALVTKLLFKKDSTKVFGVYYVKNGRKYFAKTKKEVLLSAGSINTPQILMLSGIGHRKHLNNLGIDSIKDLPVGDNVWDHPIYLYQSFSINYTAPTNNLTTQVKEYLEGKGNLASAGDLVCIGFANMMNTSKFVPDVEHVFHVSKTSEAPYINYKNLNRFTEETYENVIKPTFNITQMSTHSVLLHPKSRGTVRLRSKCPFDYPLINPNYFSHSDDGKVLVAALKDHITVANTPAMQKYNPTLIKVCHPSCNCSDFGSDDFLLCMVKTLTSPNFHFSGTAKMGPHHDKTSVVDHKLKVHGIENLRVVDCSVIPVTTSGHTSAVVSMIAEKAADIIKQQYL